MLTRVGAAVSSQALRTVGRAPIGGFFRLKYRSGSPTMSHVIPLWLVQTLNLHRWNCNVCGLSRKVTELNYVRNLAGGFLDDACRRVSTHAGASRRVSAPQPGPPDRRALRVPRRGSMEDVFCLICRPFMASCQQVAILGP